MKRAIKFMLGYLCGAIIILTIGSICVAPPILLGNYVNWWFATLLIITGPLFAYCLERLCESRFMDRLTDFMED